LPLTDKNGNFNRPNDNRLSQISVQSTVVEKTLRDSSTEFLLFLNNNSIQKLRLNMLNFLIEV
jgi:hypothetical protein